MKTFVCVILVGFFCLSASLETKQSPPKVQVYSRSPGDFGKDNVLICHVSGFYPPKIKIELLRNGQVMPDGKQTDLAFEENWFYHLTRHTPFRPNKGEEFACRVTHMGVSNIYTWEADM